MINMLNKEETNELFAYLYSVRLLHDEDFKRLHYITISKLIMKVLRLYKNELKDSLLEEINRLTKGQDITQPLDEMCDIEKTFDEEKEKIIAMASNKFIENADKLAVRHVKKLNKIKEETNEKIKENYKEEDSLDYLLENHKKTMKELKKSKHLKQKYNK
jgi:hypothetical protein